MGPAPRHLPHLGAAFPRPAYPHLGLQDQVRVTPVTRAPAQVPVSGPGMASAARPPQERACEFSRGDAPARLRPAGLPGVSPGVSSLHRAVPSGFCGNLERCGTCFSLLSGGCAPKGTPRSERGVARSTGSLGVHFSSSWTACD